jgi:hypothetical protein
MKHRSRERERCRRLVNLAVVLAAEDLRSRRRLKIITGPTKCSGDVARVIELPNGTGRIEMWEKGVGWVDAAGRVKLHEFMPGAGLPVSPRDRARLGIPASEL